MALAIDDTGQVVKDDYIMVDTQVTPATVLSEHHDYLCKISDFIESISDDLREISLSIHDNPELQYKEYHAHRILTEYLKKLEGWQVTPSAYNIDTAFVAAYNSGSKGPVISFNAEYGMPLSDGLNAPIC